MKLEMENALVNYEVKGNGLPILIFNGFATDMSSMINTLEPIFEKKINWKRIYIDHPGVGETVVDDKVESYKDVLEIILKFVDEVVTEKKFILAGNSFGGFLARYVLEKNFDRVSGLLLINPLINLRIDEANVDSEKVPIIHSDINVQENIEKRIKYEVLGAMKNTNFEFLEKLKREVEIENIMIDDKPFDKPTLILTGKQDYQVGYKDAYAILSQYPRATFCVLDKAGHNLQIEQANLFNILVDEWLLRVEEFLKIESIS